MAKYLITATRTTVCQLEVEAEDEVDAYKQVDDWYADDFERYIVDNKWYIEAEETD
jgi:hypothetical protein